jgi:geranylgeranyl diphosphate synthase type I
LLAIATDRARGDERALLSIVGSAELTPADIASVQAVLASTGAVQEIEASIDRLTREAIASIEAAPISAEASAALVELAEYVAWRDK